MKNTTIINDKITQFMTRVGDIMILNALFLLCSLPVITMGASLTAVYDMTLRILRDEDEGTVRGFFKAFKVNFKEATGIWLCFLIFIAVCVGDVFAARLPQLAVISPLLVAVGGIQAILLLSIAQYAFALTARFQNTLIGTIKNSLILMITHIPQTLIMIVVFCSPVLIFMYVPMPGKIFAIFVTLCIMLWFAGSIFFNSLILHRIFQSQFGTEEKEVLEAGASV